MEAENRCLLIFSNLAIILSLSLFFFLFFFFTFLLFRAALAAYGNSQARGGIGAAADSLHHSLGIPICRKSSPKKQKSEKEKKKKKREREREL